MSPSHNHTSLDIPVIDIRATNPAAPQQLLDAARRFGFVYVANNEAGVDPDLIAQTFDISQNFFALPVEDKRKVSIGSNAAGKNVGWLSQGVEKLDPQHQKRPDVKEAFNISLPPHPTAQTLDQPLPGPIHTHLGTILRFQQACQNLCQRLLHAFALGLGLDPDWFTSRHDPARGPTGSIFRLLYYPGDSSASSPSASSSDDDDDVRAGAHSDYGSLTCLFQLPGQPGLEIQTASGGWAAVAVNPQGAAQQPILVNIGDLLEDWTAGLLKSTVHRVVFAGEGRGVDRYSMAFFCHPLDAVRLEPVPSRLVEEYARKTQGRRVVRAGMTAKDHLMERLAATYSVE